MITLRSRAMMFDLIGTVDNLDAPVPALNKKPVAYGLMLACLMLASICGVGRLYVRCRVTKCPGWDDIFVLLSMITGTALTVATVVGFNLGQGEHFVVLVADPSRLVKYTKLSYVVNALYPTATSLIKISILLQFLRLFDAGSRYWQTTRVMFVVTLLWGLVFSFISWFPAFPPSAFWDLNDTTSVRYGIASMDANSFTATVLTLTASNMIIDMLILIIPIPYYMKAATDWKSRASLVGLFLIGSLVNLIALYRLIYILDTKAGTYPTLDPSFYGTPPSVLSALEVSLATVCASLPVFWPMIRLGWGIIFVTYEVTVTKEDGSKGGLDGDGGNVKRRYLRAEVTPWDGDEELIVVREVSPKKKPSGKPRF